MSAADEVVITPGMQAHIDRNNRYLAERSRYIREVVKKWKFDTIAGKTKGSELFTSENSSDSNGTCSGGINNYGTNSVSIVNSIVAGNSSSGAPDIVDTHDTISATNSLVQSTSGNYVTTTGGNVVGVDPDLGSLADNGAPTETMQLLPGSPILDAGMGAYASKSGAGNVMLFDGTYSYQYDADGNCIAQYISSKGWDAAIDSTATSITTFTYDNRNRLTQVSIYADDSSYSASHPSEIIGYTYDMFNNLIGRTATTYVSGTATGSTTVRYVFDGTSMVLAFDGDGNLTDRYLSGPAVDQVLADEHFSLSGTDQLPSSAGTTLWALSDNQGTVRDVVKDDGTLEQHIAYSPFGEQVSISTTVAPTVVAFAFGYTGTYTDTVTGDQLHGVRWYDPASQRWLTQDPSGLGPDSNPYRYCGNGPTDETDPSGLVDVLNMSNSDGSTHLTNADPNGPIVPQGAATPTPVIRIPEPDADPEQLGLLPAIGDWIAESLFSNPKTEYEYSRSWPVPIGGVPVTVTFGGSISVGLSFKELKGHPCDGLLKVTLGATLYGRAGLQAEVGEPTPPPPLGKMADQARNAQGGKKLSGEDVKRLERARKVLLKEFHEALQNQRAEESKKKTWHGEDPVTKIGGIATEEQEQSLDTFGASAAFSAGVHGEAGAYFIGGEVETGIKKEWTSEKGWGKLTPYATAQAGWGYVGAKAYVFGQVEGTVWAQAVEKSS